MASQHNTGHSLLRAGPIGKVPRVIEDTHPVSSHAKQMLRPEHTATCLHWSPLLALRAKGHETVTDGQCSIGPEFTTITWVNAAMLERVHHETSVKNTLMYTTGLSSTQGQPY